MLANARTSNIGIMLRTHQKSMRANRFDLLQKKALALEFIVVSSRLRLISSAFASACVCNP